MNPYLTTSAVSFHVEEFMQRAIFPLMRSGDLPRKQLAVVVALMNDEGNAILFEGKWSLDGTPLEGPYDKIARSKCEISLRTGMSSREITENHPELIQDHDTVHPGSAVLGGIVVGVSGQPNWYDEMIAIQIAAMLWAYAMNKHAEVRKSGVDFVEEL